MLPVYLQEKCPASRSWQGELFEQAHMESGTMNQAMRQAAEVRPGDSHLGFLLELARQVGTTGDLSETALPLLENTVAQTGAIGAAYLERDGRLVPKVAAGKAPGGADWETVLAGDMDGINFIVRATRQADTLVLFDGAVEAGSEPVGTPESALEEQAVALGPLLDSDDTIIGAVVGHASPNHVWTEWEEGVFTAVSALLSSLAARRRAHSDAAAARESALRALGQAISYRDYETKGHTDRVTAFAVQIGGQLGLEAGRAQQLRWGAYLHDVGKLAVPDRILLKPGPLDDEEWSTMQSHVEAGENFARELGFVPEGTLEVIRHHHERWDGDGYPDGLAGEEIPRLARIFSVCDALDAMTTQRPYNEPVTYEEALAEIASEAGSQFDPEVAKVLVRMDLKDRA